MPTIEEIAEAVDDADDRALRRRGSVDDLVLRRRGVLRMLPSETRRRLLAEAVMETERADDPAGR